MRPLATATAIALVMITPAWSASREMLTANLALWYRTDGSNSNDCLTDSPSGACRDPQGAISIASKLDIGGRIIFIKHGVTGDEGNEPRTFTGRTHIPTMFGGGSIHILGNPTPGYTIIDGNGEDCFWLDGTGMTKIGFGDLRLTSSGGSGLIHVSDTSIGLALPGLDFGPAPSAAVSVHDQNAKFEILTSLKVSGDMPYFGVAYEGSLIMEFCTVTPVGVRSFFAFVAVFENAKLKTTGCTFPTTEGNNWTGGHWMAGGGMRYVAQGGGQINTFNAGQNYFPGGQPGVPETPQNYR